MTESMFRDRVRKELVRVADAFSADADETMRIAIYDGNPIENSLDAIVQLIESERKELREFVESLQGVEYEDVEGKPLKAHTEAARGVCGEILNHLDYLDEKLTEGGGE